MSFRTSVVLACAAILAVLACGPARGELIELKNGQILQGDVKEGQTTDEGLAVNVYETGGVVVVKWDHIVASQSRELRLKLGIDLPEETTELRPGHRVMLVSGEKVEGLALNPRETNKPLQMKTRTGVKEYDRSSLAGPIEDAMIDGLIINNREELYQQVRDENPPETPAAHKALAQRCMNFQAYDHAKEHLLAAKSSEAFMATDEGKSVEQMLKVCDLMIRSQGASDLVAQIKQAMNGQRWNDALKLFNQLDKDYKDESIRNAVGFTLLENRVVKGRDEYFKKEITRSVYKYLDKLIGDKAREQKPKRDNPDDAAAKPGSTSPGTLASAKQWETRDLANQLWEKVGAELDLKADELEKYWKGRSDKKQHVAKYGAGSFIVVTRAGSGKGGAPTPPPPRRPPGSSDPKKNKGSGSSKNNTPKPAEKVEKPMTEEEWWDIATNSDKAAWLLANFVEHGGYFEVLGTPQANCDGCGGTGFTKSVGANGEDEQHFCKPCNGCGLFRSVTFR